MNRKRPVTSGSAKKLAERERQAGLEPDDEAARWLEEHHPDPKPAAPKRASKSKALHQWRRRQEGGG